MKALCSLCHRPTRLEDSSLSHDASARHAACHVAFMEAIDECRAIEKAEADDPTRVGSHADIRNH
jgi:hypothetical protein